MHADAQERAGIERSIELRAAQLDRANPAGSTFDRIRPATSRPSVRHLRAESARGASSVAFFVSSASNGSSAGRAGRRDQSKDMSSRIDLLSAARSIARSDLRSRSLVSRSSQNNYSYHKGPDFSSHRSRCLKLGRSTSQEKIKMAR
jgi:hypothetical protein